MPEPTRSEVQAHLHAIARLLRQSEHLTAEAQQALAELVDELGNALDSPALPNTEMADLTQSTAELVQALHQRHDTGVLATARDRLEQAIVGAETKAPVAADLARRLVETLSGIGI